MIERLAELIEKADPGNEGFSRIYIEEDRVVVEWENAHDDYFFFEDGTLIREVRNSPVREKGEAAIWSLDFFYNVSFKLSDL